jgi:hypothetical protein
LPGIWGIYLWIEQITMRLYGGRVGVERRIEGWRVQTSSRSGVGVAFGESLAGAGRAQDGRLDGSFAVALSAAQGDDIVADIRVRDVSRETFLRWQLR